jgi:HEAT repeat protein
MARGVTMRLTRRRILSIAIPVALLAVAALLVREWAYLHKLPPAVRDRMPGHWRIPSGLASEVQDGIGGLYSPYRYKRCEAAERLANLGRDAAPAAPFLVAILADEHLKKEPAERGGWVDGALGLLLPDRDEPLPEESFDSLFGWRFFSRREAVEALTEIGAPAIDPLMAALSDPCSSVVCRAGQALADMAHPRATAPLLDVLRDGSTEARTRSADVLGEIGDDRAVEPLMAILGDAGEDVAVRAAAARALVRTGGRAVPRLAKVLAGGDNTSRRLVLKQLGDPAWLCCGHWGDLERWLGESGGVDLGTLNAAMRAVNMQRTNGREYDPWLGWRSGKVVAALVELTKGKDLEVIRLAAGALGTLRVEKTVDDLIPLLSHDYSSIRTRAARALQSIGGDRATDALLTAAARGDQNIAYAAQSALSRPEVTSNVAWLRRHLRHPKPWLRMCVAKKLAHCGDLQAIPVLIEAVMTGNWSCPEALRKMGGSAAEPLLAVLRDKDARARARAAALLGNIADPRAADSLIAALRDEDRHVAEEAATALGKLGGRRAVGPLLAALKSTAVFLRRNAAEALGHIGDGRAVVPLIARLKDENREVMCAAAGSLARLRDPRAVEPLLAAWHEMAKAYRSNIGGADVMYNVFGDHVDDGIPLRLVRGKTSNWSDLLLLSGALARLGKPGIDLLTGALQDRDELVRIIAAMALARGDDAGGMEALKIAVPPMPSCTRAGVVKRLGATGGPASAGMLIWLAKTDPAPEVRAEALRASVRIDDGRVEAALADRLKNDPDRAVRRLALGRLVKIAGRRALPHLHHAAEADRCLSVRRTATVAAALLEREDRKKQCSR